MAANKGGRGSANPAAKLWEKVVRVTYPGSAEQIARRFVEKLTIKMKGQKCPS